MYKITRTFEDFNGVEKEQDFYFNLTKADLLKMSLSSEGDLAQRMERLVKTKDMKEAIKFFEGLLLLSYGEKTDDGFFVKTEAARNRFMSSAAYSEIYFELATNPDEAQKFIEGILPKDLQSIPAPPLA